MSMHHMNSFGSQVIEAWGSFGVRAPKITLLSTKTAKRPSSPHPHPARWPSLPAIVSPSRSSSTTASVSSTASSVSSTARHGDTLRSADTYTQLQSGKPPKKAAGQSDSGRLHRLLGRGHNAPTRSLLAEIRWEEAWSKLCSAEQSPTARKAMDQTAARHAAMRRVISSGAAGGGVAGMDDAAPVAGGRVQDQGERHGWASGGRDVIGRTPSYVPRRRGSM